MSDLEKLIRDRQDFLRGGPLPPPTWRERAREWLPEWQYFKGAPLALTVAGVLMFISAVLQLISILGQD